MILKSKARHFAGSTTNQRELKVDPEVLGKDNAIQAKRSLRSLRKEIVDQGLTLSAEEIDQEIKERRGECDSLESSSNNNFNCPLCVEKKTLRKEYESWNPFRIRVVCKQCGFTKVYDDVG